MSLALVGNKVVKADDYRGGEIRCLVCEQPLHFRKAHKRRRNGMDHTVRCHFFHNDDTFHSNESVEHKAAKRLISTSKDISYACKCLKCNDEVPIHIDGVPMEELGFGAYRLDVGFRRAGKTVGAVEVLHTHEMGPEKEAYLTSAGLAWCEVTSREVIDAVMAGRRILVENCARPFCTSCHYEERCAQSNAKTRQRIEERRKKKFAASWMQRVHHMVREDPKVVLVREIHTYLKRRFALRDIDRVLRAPEGVLTTGEHRGKHMDHVFRTHRAHVCAVAGYTGAMNAQKKPERVSNAFTDVEREYARGLMKGHCVGCLIKLEQEWQQWCMDCYVARVR